MHPLLNKCSFDHAAKMRCETYGQILGDFNSRWACKYPNKAVFEEFHPLMSVPNIDLEDSILEEVLQAKRVLLEHKSFETFFGHNMEKISEDFHIQSELLKWQVESHQHQLDLLQKGLVRLKAAHQLLYNYFKTFVKNLIPLHCIGGGRARAVSTLRVLGSVFITFDHEPAHHPEIDWVGHLIHETAHQVLLQHQLADPILQSDYNQKIWSSVRLVYRPAIGSFHALVALYFTMEAFKALYPLASEKERAFLQRFLEKSSGQQKKGLNDIKKCRLTVFGERILEEISSALVA